MNEQPKKLLDHLLSIDRAVGALICRTAVSAVEASHGVRDQLLSIVDQLVEVRNEIWSIEELRSLLQESDDE